MALDGRHPDADRLAEYADRVLNAETRASVDDHLADCADCRAVVMETMAFLASNPVRTDMPSRRVVHFRSRRRVTLWAVGLAAAAALVIAVRVARPEWSGNLFGRHDRTELQELIAAVANESTRPVEGRLSGGFKYAPPPSPTRGPGDREVSPDVRIAAARIERTARPDEGPERRVEVGLAHLALGDIDAAIAALGEAARLRPSDASIQSDLAVAFIARAARGRARADIDAALSAARRALAVDPRSAAAAFNQALALELLGDSEATVAWNRARELQEEGPWRAEADRHLAELRDRSGR